jgi:hypothetical protein
MSHGRLRPGQARRASKKNALPQPPQQVPPFPQPSVPGSVRHSHCLGLSFASILFLPAFYCISLPNLGCIFPKLNRRHHSYPWRRAEEPVLNLQALSCATILVEAIRG